MKKILAKIQNSKLAKAVSVASATSLVACLGAVSVFAEAPDASIQTALSTAFSTLQSNMITYLGLALPAALGVVAIVFAVKFGVRFFLSLIPKK